MASEVAAKEPSGSLGPAPAELVAADVNRRMRAPLTALVVLAPLGLIGELYRWLGQPPGGTGELLLADPLLAELGRRLGALWQVLPVLALINGCLIAQVVGRHRWEPPRARVLLMVAMWAVIWGAVRIVLSLTWQQIFHLVPDGIVHHTTVAHVGLALRGALQEELFFRCLLIGGLAIIARALELPAWIGAPAAVAISATFFSLAHTMVVNHFPGAEPFAWPAFGERFLAGALYGMVMIRQGLAVATLAHAGYNLTALFVLS